MKGEETEEEEGTERRSSKVGAKTDTAMTPSVVKEANTSEAGDNRACSDGRSRKNKYGNSERTRTRNGDGSQERSLCHWGG